MLAASRPWYASFLLCSSQVVAEFTGRDTEGKGVSRPIIKQSAGRKASGDKQRQLLNLRIRGEGDGPEDTESAVASRVAKWNDDLIKKSIEAPTSPCPRAGVEIGKDCIVVPKADFVVAEERTVAGQSVELITSLCDDEWRPVH